VSESERDTHSFFIAERAKERFTLKAHTISHQISNSLVVSPNSEAAAAASEKISHAEPIKINEKVLRE
jgi:hypothetical protein